MRNQKGFTIVELMIVVAIVSIIIAMVVPYFGCGMQKTLDPVSGEVLSVDPKKVTLFSGGKPVKEWIVKDGRDIHTFRQGQTTFSTEDGDVVIYGTVLVEPHTEAVSKK